MQLDLNSLNKGMDIEVFQLKKFVFSPFFLIKFILFFLWGIFIIFFKIVITFTVIFLPLSICIL